LPKRLEYDIDFNSGFSFFFPLITTFQRVNMAIPTSTNERLRSIMAEAQAHRNECTVNEGALSSLHTPEPQKAIPIKGLLANIRAAFKNFLSALPEDAPGTAQERRAVMQEVTRLDQPSYFQVMSNLSIDWAEPIVPNGPYAYAHKAAMLGMLPNNFEHWGLRDRTGATVAHIAAEKGHLPASFTHWEISRGDGWTVAHEAAINGNLPTNVDPAVMAWTDHYGKTVGQCVKDHARNEEIKHFNARMH
jgi:hypothetical protein